MFYILYDYSPNIGDVKLCLHCDPENVLNFKKDELPSIFSNYGKQFSNALLDVEIVLKCRRRIYAGAELIIEMNKSFSCYEIEIYSEKDHKPFVKCKTDREVFFANDLDENCVYVARVRGVNEEHRIYSKWSKEVLFYPLKGNL